MKRAILLCVLSSVSCLLFVGGCGSEAAAAGGGLLAGFGASETVKGIQADLERRETALVERYQAAVAAGAEAEQLERIEGQIAETQAARQGTAVVTQTDWTDPAAAGGAIGTIGMLAYALLTRKRLTNTSAAIRTIRAKSDEASKQQLDQVLLENGVG